MLMLMLWLSVSSDLIVFVIAVRLFAMNGRQLLKHWAEILKRKNTLFAFAMILTGRDGFGKLEAALGSRRALAVGR